MHPNPYLAMVERANAPKVDPAEQRRIAAELYQIEFAHYSQPLLLGTSQVNGLQVLAAEL